MTFRGSINCAVLFLAFPLVTYAASCQPHTLDFYIGLGASGCTVGQFTFANFSFSVIASSGGPTAVLTSAINVTPVLSGGEYGLSYSSNEFTVATGQMIQYLLAFRVGDPPIIHGYAAHMTTDPPVFPGMVTITSDECLGADFSGSTCPDSTASETVFSNGLTSSLDNEQFFSPVALIGDRTTVTLDATAGGSAEFLSLSEAVLVPEPVFAWPMLVGLTVFFGRLLRGVRFAFKAR
jgi:hypothetical protein